MITRTTTNHQGADPASEPEWGRIPVACRRSSIGRTSIYDLISEGKIKSCVVKKRGNIRGIRLIHLPSLDNYLNGLAGANGQGVGA